MADLASLGYAQGMERAAQLADHMYEFAVGAGYTQSWKDCAKEIARAIREEARSATARATGDDAQ